MTALMLVALTVTGAGTLTLLHSYLQGQVDDKLRAAVTSVRQQQSFSQLRDQNQSVPTDYSLMLFAPGQQPVPFGGDKDIHPDITSMTAAETADRQQNPFQVRGTDGRNWRVVALNVVDGNNRSTVVVIGLPLGPVDSVMEHAVLVVVGVGLLTLVLAFFIATWSISRSFRPLARVEKTAAAIAAIATVIRQTPIIAILPPVARPCFPRGRPAFFRRRAPVIWSNAGTPQPRS